ncbi:MAG TPA: L-histidine N(alpha)-methyltransferase, partial [Methylomirabilota bacterium]|nr:L-histidine N(alpha)-methyltransferase [Methylomirabilota bacterium]
MRSAAARLHEEPPYVIERAVDAGGRRRALARDVSRGLGDRPRWLPPKYFYDAAGSALFERITRLPEYYLTRAEQALLDAHGAALVRALGPDDVVELGAGSPAKVRPLLDARRAPVRYVPVDIDEDGVTAAARSLARERPGVRVHGIVGDFEHHLRRVPPAAGRRLVLFLGSTLGNLHALGRQRLLREVRGLLGAHGRCLLGLDLVKDRARLEAAYDDAAGVTREFNRNVLRV